MDSCHIAHQITFGNIKRLQRKESIIALSIEIRSHLPCPVTYTKSRKITIENGSLHFPLKLSIAKYNDCFVQDTIDLSEYSKSKTLPACGIQNIEVNIHIRQRKLRDHDYKSITLPRILKWNASNKPSKRKPPEHPPSSTEPKTASLQQHVMQ